jgi:hypothetical protein
MDETQVVHLYIYTSIYRLIRLQDSTSLATDTRGEATQRAPKYRVVLDVELRHVPDLARCANKSGSKIHVSIHIRYNNTGMEPQYNSIPQRFLELYVVVSH